MKKLEYELVHRIVLITDIHNFSLISSTLRSQLPDFIQKVYMVLGDDVVGYGGELLKYLGDGFLAVYPEGLEAEAVKSGLKMREDFRKTAGEWGLGSETELEVGLSAGSVFEGMFGHSSFICREIIGEPVMEAAMICHYRGVAVAEPVYKSLGSGFNMLPLEDQNLKWRESPLKVWAAGLK